VSGAQCTEPALLRSGPEGLVAGDTNALTGLGDGRYCEVREGLLQAAWNPAELNLPLQKHGVLFLEDEVPSTWALPVISPRWCGVVVEGMHV
jgi:hypothetical protein